MKSMNEFHWCDEILPLLIEKRKLVCKKDFRRNFEENFRNEMFDFNFELIFARSIDVIRNY